MEASKMTDTEEIIETEEKTEETALVATEPQAEEKPKDPKANWLMIFLRTYRRPLLGAVVGVLAACMFMWLGFWKTLFILGMAGLGAYLFGADHKMQTFKRLINRFFPGRK